MEGAQTLNFSVDGEGLTEIVRGLYIDGKRDKALAILYHINGLPVAEACKILEGKRKLVSTPEGGIVLADDNVDVKPTQVRSRAHDHDWFGERHPGHEATLTAVYQDEDDFINIDELHPTDPRKPMLDARDSWSDRLRHAALPPPEPDLALKTDTGWLLPDGKLYACSYRGHEALAFRLGVESYNVFFGVPGWLHLEDGTWRMPNALRHEGMQPTVVTQAQIDTIFDWCRVHGKDLPDWFGKVATE